jgi:hypothetical protein
MLAPKVAQNWTSACKRSDLPCLRARPAYALSPPLMGIFAEEAAESVGEIDALRGTFWVQELGASTRNRSAQPALICSSAELIE